MCAPDCVRRQTVFLVDYLAGRSAETTLFQASGLSKHIAISTLALEHGAGSTAYGARTEKGVVVKRFAGFEDAALLGRLERLDRAETDLQKRVAARISQVDAEGRWLRSDPLFQQLSSALKRVRLDMREAEQELLRRGSVSAVREVVLESA